MLCLDLETQLMAGPFWGLIWRKGWLAALLFRIHSGCWDPLRVLGLVWPWSLGFLLGVGARHPGYPSRPGRLVPPERRAGGRCEQNVRHWLSHFWTTSGQDGNTVLRFPELG